MKSHDDCSQMESSLRTLWAQLPLMKNPTWKIGKSVGSIFQHFLSLCPSAVVAYYLDGLYLVSTNTKRSFKRLFFNMEKNYNNKIYEGSEEEIPFEYNFVNRPWDDRSKNSKIGIVSLLLAIFLAIAACMVNSFMMYYRGFQPKVFLNKVESSCHLVKRDEYRFVARIHSVASKELLCVGAVLSLSTVLANQVCVKAGPIFLFLGSSFDPRCRKGFPVNVQHTTSVQHEGVVAKSLIIIVSSESLAACGTVISIGMSLDWEHPAYIIGRPLLNTVRSLTKLPVTLEGKGNCSIPLPLAQKVDSTKVLCVKDVGHCMVRAGDLLVQNGYLLGIASSSAHRSDIFHTAYFADLSISFDEIMSNIKSLE